MSHTCLACGDTSDDVRMTVVEVEPDEQRIVEVPIVSAEERGQIRGFDYVPALERYASEPRCRDKAACRARVEAMEAPKPAPADVEEGPTWMHA